MAAPPKPAPSGDIFDAVLSSIGKAKGGKASAPTPAKSSCSLTGKVVTWLQGLPDAQRSKVVSQLRAALDEVKSGGDDEGRDLGGPEVA